MDIREVDVSFHNPFLPPIWRQPIAGANSWFGLSYAHVQGYRPMVLDLHVPAEANQPVPCVIYLHGGSFHSGDRRHLPENWTQNSLFEKVVAAGMAVASVDYRLIAEAGPTAQLEDCAAAVRYLRHFADELGLDATRFALWGESAGGTLAALVAFLASGSQPAALGALGVTGTSAEVQKLVLYYPATDLVRLASELPQVLPAITQSQLQAASPINHVHPNIPSTLVVHGDADATVPYEQGAVLHERLREIGVDSQLQTVTGADHCFRGAAVDPILDSTISWLAEPNWP